VIPLIGTHYLMVGFQPVVRNGLGAALVVRWMWDGSRKGHDLKIGRFRHR